VAAAGSAVEILGIHSNNDYTMVGGYAILAAGVYYSLRQLPEENRHFVEELFHIPLGK
jgi:hypothetical protein